MGRKFWDVLEHRSGLDLERPIKGARGAMRADVTIALLERYAVVPSAVRRAGLPPYRGGRLAMLSVWLGEEMLHASAEQRETWRKRLQGIDLTIVLSQSQVEVFDALGVPEDRLLVTGFGVDTEFYRPDPDQERDIDLLAVGIDRGRDYGTLFEALRGSGLRATVVCKPENLVGLNPPPEVEVLGPVPHTTYRDLLRRAKVVVVPTHELNYPTGQSVALEGAASGAAVVVSGTKPMQEYFTDKETAYLTPVGEPEAMLDVLRSALSDDEGRERVAAAGNSLVKEKYTFGHMWSEVAERINAS